MWFLQFSWAIVKKFISGGQLGIYLEFPKETLEVYEFLQILSLKSFHNPWGNSYTHSIVVLT